MRWNPNTYKATWENAMVILRGWLEPHILSRMMLKKGAKVLECGVGCGKWSAAFAMLGYNVYALDNLPEMTERLKSNFPNLNITTVLRDVREANFLKNKKVALLFSEGLLEHFLDKNERKNVLNNFYEAVETRGYIAIVVPFESEEEDEIAYSDAMLMTEIRDAGFYIINGYHMSFLSEDKVTKRKMVGVNAQK